jgi:hypothetical protein
MVPKPSSYQSLSLQTPSLPRRFGKNEVGAVSQGFSEKNFSALRAG